MLPILDNLRIFKTLRSILVSSALTSTLALSSCTSAARLAPLPGLDRLDAVAAPRSDVAWSAETPDGRFFITGSTSGVVALWDSESGQRVDLAHLDEFGAESAR